MEPEKEVKFSDLIQEFSRQKIRYLIIGRRAVVLYGGPVLTGDYDLWIHPEDKRKTLSLLLDKLDFELSHAPDTKSPIVTGFSGMKNMTSFFRRALRTLRAKGSSLKSATRIPSSKKIL